MATDRRHDVDRPLMHSSALCPFLSLEPRLGRRGPSPATACSAHLQRLDSDGGVIFPHGFDGRLCRGPARAPSLDEWSWFCIHGWHTGCSTSRRARQIGEGGQ